jgi:hypothetical protein
MLPAEQTARTTSQLESNDDDHLHALLLYLLSHFNASFLRLVRSLLFVPADMSQFFLRKIVLAD